MKIPFNDWEDWEWEWPVWVRVGPAVYPMWFFRHKLPHYVVLPQP